MMRTKNTSHYTPQRTCVGCRQAKPKRELIRLVRTSTSLVKVDPDGKSTGRGAYLCKNPDCWQAGLKTNRLDYALKTKLTTENREQLMRQGNELLEN